MSDGLGGGAATVAPGAGAGALEGLRRLGALRPRAESLWRCDLCAAEIAPHPHHEHLLEPAARQVACACTPCALLFPPDAHKRYLRVPRRLWHLNRFELTDEQWDALAVPVNIAYFHTTTRSGEVRVEYPSPAGATESLLTLEGWTDVVAANPVLKRLQPDVEALLVYRIGSEREHFLVPIDRCFELVGLIRVHWRGLSGGGELWQHVAEFFTDLRQHAVEREARDA